MKSIIISINFLLLFLNTSYGQTENILLGTTEYHFNDEGEHDKQNPYVGIFFFMKSNNIWSTIQDTLVQEEISVNLIKKGSKLASRHVKNDTSVKWRWYFSTFTFDKKIPNVGRKTILFSGMSDEYRYKPLILTNSNHFKRNHKPRFRNVDKADSLIVRNFLVKKADDLNLGNLDTAKNIIEKINRVLQINNNVYFIEADINLNMYCYKENVPFDTDISYFMTGTEKSYIADNKKTYSCYFLVNNGEVSYVDYDLKFLDNVDLDNDGYDELIFRMDKYNYSAYLLVTDKCQTFLTNKWSYH